MPFELNSNNSKQIKDLKLNTLLQITKAINNNTSTDKLLEIFREILETHLKIRKLLLFSESQSGWKCILKFGFNDEFNTINVERDLFPVKEMCTINLSEQTQIKSFEIIIPVFHKSKPLAYLLIGDLEDKVEVSPAIKHLNFVQTITNIIVVAIENKKLAKKSILQAALKKEMEFASQMQSMLFPSILPNDAQLNAAAFYLPQQEVGGDYYDFIWLNANEFAFCVADVSGKGVPAALLMSNFQANLRVLLFYIPSLTELVKELNSKVMASAKGEKFITFFIAKYNLKTQTLTYVNAAHNPPLLASGNTISELKIGCTGLGMFDEIGLIEEGILSISPDSTILCYTDGLVELENEKSQNFGLDALKDIIKLNSKLDMNSLNNLIIETISNYKQSRPYFDDIALFSLKIH